MIEGIYLGTKVFEYWSSEILEMSIRIVLLYVADDNIILLMKFKVLQKF